MRLFLGLYVLLFAVSVLGCETVHNAAKETGKVAGKTMDTIGGISEGGAEVYQGGEADGENPYGR